MLTFFFSNTYAEKFDDIFHTADIVKDDKIVSRGMSRISKGFALQIAIDMYLCDLLEERGITPKLYHTITHPK